MSSREIQNMCVISPAIAVIDRNMVEDDGLIPAATEFVRGFLSGPLEVGQLVQAEDEDGVIAAALIERVAPGLVFLRVEPQPAWHADEFPYSHSPIPSGSVKTTWSPAGEAVGARR